MSEARPIMIIAGGTGGHVYPALEVARCLLNMNVPVVWMGTQKGLEARVVPKAGIRINWLTVEGLRGKGLLAWLFAPLRLNLAIVQALMIILRQKPRVVLGMGGFVAGPGGVVAFMLSRPLVIHEQNAIPGLTNRLLAPLCDRLLEGFPNTFKSSKARYVGNPVRKEITELPAPELRFSDRQGPLRLLVLGGSLGARVLNDIVPQTLRQFSGDKRLDVWHQTGHQNIEDARHKYKNLEQNVRVEPFIEDMASAYAWADLVLCRAGAITLAELCAVGIGAVLVPYPFAVDDHQTANARFFVEAGAGVLIAQTDLTLQRLASFLMSFERNRDKLLAMAVTARKLARSDAGEVVARICLEASQPNPKKQPTRFTRE